MSKGFKVGLALGGGAARALSHVGIIAGLEKHRIPIDIVTGTSMGAIIGAIYAVRPDSGALRQRISDYLESEEFAASGFDFFKELDSRGEGLLHEVTKLVRRGVFNAMAVTRIALVDDEVATRNYAFLVEDLEVQQTRLPFAATGLDLLSGESVILARGPLRQVIAASCAMPGVLNPVRLGDRMLVDGGWAEAIPVRAALSLGADCVIAVDVAGRLADFEPPRNSLDIIGRADALVRCALADEQLRSANVVLTPRNGVKHWADFSTADQAIASGEEEVEKSIGRLRRAIRRARLRHFFGRPHPGR